MCNSIEQTRKLPALGKILPLLQNRRISTKVRHFATLRDTGVKRVFYWRRQDQFSTVVGRTGFLLSEVEPVFVLAEVELVFYLQRQSRFSISGGKTSFLYAGFFLVQQDCLYCRTCFLLVEVEPVYYLQREPVFYLWRQNRFSICGCRTGFNCGS